MSGFRIAKGGLINREQTLDFTFDGRKYQGVKGDTLASALLANGVRIVGRSFKYHRPRGVWGVWFDDPNAIFDLTLKDVSLPNCPATTTHLVEGMSARAVNAYPSAQFDIKGVFDRFHRFMPAGFYYKTFKWPHWHLFEPVIRKMAGLGHLGSEIIEGYQSEQHNIRCDLLVIGGGPAGLAGAQAAAQAGQSVILVDDHPEFGGGLYRRSKDIEGVKPAQWVARQCRAIEAAGGRLMPATTAFGVYDHNMVALAQDKGFGLAPTLWRVRAKRILMATGATDRPVTFANNDRPGVMSLDGALEYLARYGVLVGRKIAVLSNNSFVEPAAEILRRAGGEVRVLDATQGQAKALGNKVLHGVEMNGQRFDCDTLLASSGLTPVVHLWRHAGGKLDWDENLAAFIPGKAPDNMRAAGAANGTFDLDNALSEARAKAIGAPVPKQKSTYRITPLWPKPDAKARQWIDFQHDVTLKDIELAARENYASVEHLKRYTTLGMASDQGKTSNMTGLAAMAALQGRSIPEVGTTTFRPPFVPVPIGLYGGARRGQLFNPLKRLVLEDRHRAAGAALGEYGGWLRPGWYGARDITREVLRARNAAGILDASPLGKIEVMGPDAASFVNFIYYNTISTLKTGCIRYGFMLTEGGIVYDDGVIARLADNHFVISCSSSHVESVTAALESWRQDGNDPDRIFIHDCTQNWPTVTVTGPKAREIMDQLDLSIDLADFPHMTWRETRFKQAAARVARVSFTGDTSYEISVPVDKVHALWDAVILAGKPLGAGPIGVEALSVLRAEKGYIIVGKDTDGEVMPHDLGFAIPRAKKTAAFVGDRGLHTDNANREDRRQLVGLRVPDGAVALATGAHLVEKSASGLHSIGVVTSSYNSPSIGQPIALALVEKGTERMGETLTIWHMDQQNTATVVSPVFLDPKGARLNAG